jgi:restriction endonuclease S subunit
VKLSNDKILKKNDIFICLASWSKEHIWKVAFIYQDTEFYFWWFMWAIRIKKSDISAKYLFYQLSNLRFNKFINSQIAWTNINNLSWKILYNFTIPIPPLEIQEQIVEELDNYQKIIDGAKLIVNNYKPKIKIDESWDVVELGEVCEIISWQSPESKFYNQDWIWYPFFQWKTEFTEKYIWNPKNWTTKITKESIKWDILMSVRAPVWPVNINLFDKICIWRWLCAIRPNKNILLEFIFDYLLLIQTNIKWNWWAIFDSINRKDIEEIKIPLPPLEIQEQIVAKIEEEQKMVESTKWLIDVFENKIKERIWEVWGE